MKKYFVTFPIFYKFNKELFFDTLYYNILKQIKQKYQNLKEKTKDKKISNSIQEVKNKIINLIILKQGKVKDPETALLYNILNNVELYFGTKFYDYIINFSNFMNKIYDNFLRRFKDNKIFENSSEDDEKKTSTQDIDLNLFTDFVFFIRSYNFEKEEIKFYSEYWNDSFIHIPFNSIKPQFKDFSFLKINNNLEVNNIKDKTTFTINNIDDYCIEPLLYYICYLYYQSDHQINVCNLNKYIRMDRYNSVSFIKTHWDEISAYFCEILCSPVIISIFNEMILKYDSFKSHLFLNEDEIKKIINNIRFFNFDSDFTGDTQGRIMMVYVTGIINTTYEPDINKLVYLSTLLIVLVNEIVGHVNVRYQNFLNKNEKKFLSPKPEFESDYSKKRKKESGEFIEGALFGDYKCQMTLREILFILDKRNYYEKKDYIEFRKEFEKCKNLKLDNVSDELKKIMELYEININEENLNENENQKYSVQRNSAQKKYTFPNHHSFNKIHFK